MNINATTARTITNEVDIAITAIFSRHGLARPSFSTTYGDFLKIIIKAAPETLDHKGVNLTSPEALAYEKYGDTYGLKPNLLGVHFFSKGVEYIFTGISPNRPKFPINSKSVKDGRPFKMTEDAARAINKAGEAS